MELAELLLLAVAVALVGIGYLFGRGSDAEQFRLRQEISEKDEELAETMAAYHHDMDRLIRTTDDLYQAMNERDQRDQFIGQMRGDEAFEAWRDGVGGPASKSAGASAAEITSWLEEGLGLVEGVDFLRRPHLDFGSPPEFIRLFNEFAWPIDTFQSGGPKRLHAALSSLAEADTSYLTMPLLGHTNLGHMVLVANPDATARGILPAGYENFEPLFLVSCDFAGFAVADRAMQVLAGRLSSATMKVDSHQVELHANALISQGQDLVRRGHQLVSLGESMRTMLTGSIPFALVDSGEPVIDLTSNDGRPSGPPTMRMERDLPQFNPMEGNPAPLRGNAKLADTTVSANGSHELDDDEALLDRLDQDEREAIEPANGSSVSPARPGSTDERPAPAGTEATTGNPPRFV